MTAVPLLGSIVFPARLSRVWNMTTAQLFRPSELRRRQAFRLTAIAGVLFGAARL